MRTPYLSTMGSTIVPTFLILPSTFILISAWVKTSFRSIRYYCVVFAYPSNSATNKNPVLRGGFAVVLLLLGPQQPQ